MTKTANKQCRIIIVIAAVNCDWLTRTDVTEIVPQLGFADGSFSAGETRARENRLLSQGRIIPASVEFSIALKTMKDRQSLLN